MRELRSPGRRPPVSGPRGAPPDGGPRNIHRHQGPRGEACADDARHLSSRGTGSGRAGAAPAAGTWGAPARKKLLVLDINGLLVDTVYKHEHAPRQPDAIIGNFLVYERPFCREFLRFCLRHFVVGIWSSARMHNVTGLINHVFGDLREQLAFIWDQVQCTKTRLVHPNNKNKPIFLKELSRLWGCAGPTLPWRIGDHGPADTLLMDDSPYKAICNPPYTAIFPASYIVHMDHDRELGPGGAIQSYLERLTQVSSVQKFVQAHPIGESALSIGHPSWNYFKCLLEEREQDTAACMQSVRGIQATRANLPTAGSEEAVRCAEGSYDFSQTRRIRLPASKSSGSSRLYTEEHRGDKVDASSLGSSYQHQARTYTDKEDRYSSSGYGDLIPRSSSQIQDKEDRLHSPYASSQAGLRSQPSLAGNDTRTRLVQHVQSAQDRSRQDGKVSVSCDQYLDLSSGRSGRRMADWQDVCPSYGEDPVNAQALLGNCSMSGDVDIPSRYDYADSYGWSTAQVSQEDCNTRVPSQYFYANAYGWSSQQEASSLTGARAQGDWRQFGAASRRLLPGERFVYQ